MMTIAGTIPGPSADAERLFGEALARHRAGDLEGARLAYLRVTERRPDDAAPYVNLGIALQGLGWTEAAVAAYRQALVRQPQAAAAWANLGCALLASGRPGPALGCLQRAAAVDPTNEEVHNSLGSLLAALGRPDLAIPHYRQAVALAPERCEPYNNLGAALIEAGEIPAGIAACRRALWVQPGNAQAHNNLANALIEQGLADEAIAAYRRALELRPQFPEACTNLSGALIDQGRGREAIALCRQAVTVQPDFAQAYNNLGNACHGMLRFAEAEAAFRRAIALTPDDAEVHFNFAAVLLKTGRLAEGWREFEWRKRTPLSPFRKIDFAQPEWDGAPLAGRSILLYGEQGLGDVLQFVRFAPHVATDGRAIVRAYPPLVRLLRSLPGIAQVISTEDPLPDFDCHLPLMSLPAVLGAELDGVPRDIPYLWPHPADVDEWRTRLAGLPGLKVGLVWAGDPRPHEPEASRMDRRRSLHLDQLAGLAEIPGISLISLQKGRAAGQAKSPPPGMTLFDAMDEVADFADTAALVANLDLVISVDTSVAHLAGALGKPVWILSRFDGCWRWLDGRDDSPWYPTARLFRQTSWGDWGLVLDRVVGELRKLAAG